MFSNYDESALFNTNDIGGYSLDKVYTYEERVRIMQIIHTLQKNRGWLLFKSTKMNLEAMLARGFTEADMRKMYVAYGWMDIVVKKIISFCPTLKDFDVNIDDKKLKLIKQALEENDWETHSDQLYNDLETRGDVYYYIYFKNKKDKIPKLKKLKSHCMTDILTDQNDEVTGYRYEVPITEETMDKDGNITTQTRTVTWMFEKGKTTILDSRLDGGREVYTNRPSYKDDIPIVHIKANSQDGTMFSEIPAESYVEHVMQLDTITSNIANINKILGFPNFVVMDAILEEGDRSPAGMMYFKTIRDETTSSSNLGVDKGTIQGSVQDIQISNDLQSIFTEYENVAEMLFICASLVSLKSEDIIGRSDSSQVVKQFRLPLENKINTYINNIIKPMRLFFKIVLAESKLYNEETDKYLSFEKPEFIIETSPMDKLLYQQMLLTLGLKSVADLKKEEGMTDVEVQEHLKKLYDEMKAKQEATSNNQDSANNNVKKEE